MRRFYLAYIDPGSGYMVLQVLAAGVLGAVVYFRKMIWKVTHIFSGKGKTGDSNSQED